MATTKKDKAVGQNTPAKYKNLRQEQGRDLAGRGTVSGPEDGAGESWHWRTIEHDEGYQNPPRVPLAAERRGEIRK